MALLQVIGWNDCFETNRTRGTLTQTYCQIPNKQGGGGYTILLAMEDGEAMYGAFHAMILYLSKQPERDGWLTKDGTKNGDPYTAKYLADQIQFSETTTKNMLTAVTQDIGWLINHSLKKQPEGVAYPGKIVDIKFIALAQKFHRAQIKAHPNQSELQETEIAKTTLAGARLLEEFHLDLKWSDDKIETLLGWILDDAFWGNHIRSLGSIMRPSRNNNAYKFENALAAMEAEMALTLLTGEQVKDDMYKRGLGTKDYTQVINERTGETLWRRNS